MADLDANKEAVRQYGNRNDVNRVLIKTGKEQLRIAAPQRSYVFGKRISEKCDKAEERPRTALASRSYKMSHCLEILVPKATNSRCTEKRVRTRQAYSDTPLEQSPSSQQPVAYKPYAPSQTETNSPRQDLLQYIFSLLFELL